MRNFDAAFNPTSRMPFAHQASIRNISTNGKLLHRPLDCLLSYQLWTRPLTSELHKINIFTISLPSLYHIPDSVTGIAPTSCVSPLPNAPAISPDRKHSPPRHLAPSWTRQQEFCQMPGTVSGRIVSRLVSSGMIRSTCDNVEVSMGEHVLVSNGSAGVDSISPKWVRRDRL
jgi:hypothetical protein